MCVQAHLVAAFEQSLGNMTIRLQSLTTTAEQKVRECICMYRYICVWNVMCVYMTEAAVLKPVLKDLACRWSHLQKIGIGQKCDLSRDLFLEPVLNTLCLY